MKHNSGFDSARPNHEQQMLTRAKLLTEAAMGRNGGAILNIISADDTDSDNLRALSVIKNTMAVSNARVKFIDVEKVVTALELGIKTHQFGIDEETLETQSLAETVFQIVYQGFGKEGKGWQIGFSSMHNNLFETTQKLKESKNTSAFTDFLDTLDTSVLDSGNSSPASPNLIVLQFPSLDRKKRITHKEDANLGNLDEETALRVETYMDILSLITQVYPSKFNSTDNPHHNIVVNLVDISYRYSAARNMQWYNTYEFLSDSKIMTPNATTRDDQLLYS